MALQCKGMKSFGKRYQRALAAEGIDARLLPSDGLRRPTCNCCETASRPGVWCKATRVELLPDDPENLVSLAACLWSRCVVFYRTEAAQRHVRAPLADGLRHCAACGCNAGSRQWHLA